MENIIKNAFWQFDLSRNIIVKYYHTRSYCFYFDKMVIEIKIIIYVKLFIYVMLTVDITMDTINGIIR